MLDTPALCVLIVLMASMRPYAAGEKASVRITRKTLMQRTGYSINKITEAISSLKQAGFIEQSPNWEQERRKKKGWFGVCQYILLDGIWRMPLIKRPGQNVLFSNGISYLYFPECVIRETAERWSLAQMSGSEIRVYVACLIMLESIRQAESPSLRELKKISGLDLRTVRKALEGLESHGLIWTLVVADSFRIDICNPYTGTELQPPDEDAEHDPANYFRRCKDGVSRPVVLNMTPQETEDFIRSRIPKGEPIDEQSNGELMIRCPFHDDNTPSCSVSPAKHGIFHCYGCDESGTLFKLIAGLTGSTSRMVIEMVANEKGQQAEFHQPDSDAKAIYTYRDEWGNRLKQVLRFEDTDGNKRFVQRRPMKGAYKYDVRGLPPLLYNRDKLLGADTVFLLEGEKDADTATSLSLLSNRGGRSGERVIGVTSGGANSWDARLATHLRGCRVVLMPDDDAPGRAYADAVRKSLKAEDIEYREISFSGSGAKDLTDYMADHTTRDLIGMIGSDWVLLPDGSALDPADDPFALVWQGPRLPVQDLEITY